MVRFQMSPLSAKNSDHAVIHAGSICLAIISQMVADILFFLAKDSCVPNGLFQTSSRNVSETFPLDVTMDWWSESYWILIDLWSTAWLSYAAVGLFKRNVLGPESCNPEIHPPVFYLMWAVINISRICSMIQWDRHDIIGAITLEWILPVLSFYMLSMSYTNLYKHRARLAVNNPSVVMWTRYLIQNGLAVFAWWSLLNAVVGFGIALKYKAGLPDPGVSSIVLAIVTLCALHWFFLQTFQFAKYLRHTFSVYAILILGLGAMFTRSYLVHDMAANTVYCGFLMLLLTIMSTVHLISACLQSERTSKRLILEPYLKSGVCETVCQPEAYIKHKVQM